MQPSRREEVKDKSGELYDLAVLAGVLGPNRGPRTAKKKTIMVEVRFANRPKDEWCCNGPVTPTHVCSSVADAHNELLRDWHADYCSCQLPCFINTSEISWLNLAA